MSDKNNVTPAPLKPLTATDKNAPYFSDVEAIKARMDKTLSNIKPKQTPSGTKTLLTVKIENDDLVHGLNKGNTTAHDFTDGGILTSQLSIGTSIPIKTGFLKNGSITGELSATTSTAWGNIDEKLYTNDPALFNGIKTDKPIIDGGQLPTSEKYSLTVSALKPITLNNTQKLDIGARLDTFFISGKPNIQNEWHDKLNNAHYLLSQTNTVKEGLAFNAELTGVHHFTKTTSKNHRDITLLSGAALGNAYQGAMMGVDASIGSPSSQYFPQMSHSAMFGNTNPDHVVQGGIAKPGAWKLSAYAKIYASTKNDYRTQMSAQALTPNTGTITFNSSILKDDIITKTVLDGHQNPLTVQAFDITRTTETMDYSIPAPVLRYDFKPINAAVGIRAQLQLSHSVNIGAHVGYITNPSKPITNPGYEAGINKIANFYSNKPFVTEILSIENPTQLSQTQEYVRPDLAADHARFSTNKKPPAENAFGNFTGEVLVNITLGGGHKKGGGRGH